MTLTKVWIVWSKQLKFITKIIGCFNFYICFLCNLMHVFIANSSMVTAPLLEKSEILLCVCYSSTIDKTGTDKWHFRETNNVNSVCETLGCNKPPEPLKCILASIWGASMEAVVMWFTLLSSPLNHSESCPALWKGAGSSCMRPLPSG